MPFMHLFKLGVAADAIEDVTAPLSDSDIVEEEESEPEDEEESPAERYCDITSFSTHSCISKVEFVLRMRKKRNSSDMQP